MPRIRSIKPELPQDAKLARVSRNARLTFLYLLTQVDDAGYFRASPRILVGQLFPHDVDVTEAVLEGWLCELAQAGRIKLFDSEDGAIGQIVNFLKHQRIDHPTKSYLASLSRNVREPLASRVLSLDLTDEESPPIGGPKKSGSKSKEKKSVKIPLPDSWQPTEAHRDLAKKLGVDVELEADKFRDHAAANDWRKVKWDPTFNNWLRNAKQFSNGKSTPQASPIIEDVLSLIRVSPSLIWHADGRQTAFDIMAKKRSDVWARAGPVMKQLHFAELQSVKDNDRELRNAIQNQLSHIDTAGNRNGHPADVAGIVPPRHRGTG